MIINLKVDTNTTSIMKYSLAILLFLFTFFMGSACDKETPVPNSADAQNNGYENNDSMSNKIRIKVGDKTFMATLSDNATAAAFQASLPMTMMLPPRKRNENKKNLCSLTTEVFI